MTARRADDAGESLLEILIAIAIMGIAFTGLFGGMLTAASMSGLHRQQADSQLELLRAVETIKAAPYIGDCASYTPGTNLYDVPPSPYAPGWTVQETVEYWDGVDFAACNPNLPSYYATQRITVVVASPDRRVSRTEIILKRG